jgi:phage gp16-like protein
MKCATPVLARRARLIRLIHIAKAQLGLDDETYRALLRRETDGQASSTKDMPIGHLEKVLDRMKASGFTVTVPAGKGEQRRLADDGQSRKIRHLWLELHQAGVVRSPEESALASYVKRLTRVSALQWLSTEQASVVIETLKKWLERATEQRGTKL